MLTISLVWKSPTPGYNTRSKQTKLGVEDLSKNTVVAIPPEIQNSTVVSGSEGAASFSAESSSLGAGGALALASGDITSSKSTAVSDGSGANADGGSVPIDIYAGMATSPGSITFPASDAGFVGVSDSLALSTDGMANDGDSGLISISSGSSGSGTGTGGNISLPIGSGGTNGSSSTAVGVSPSAADGGKMSLTAGSSLAGDESMTMSMDDAITRTSLENKLIDFIESRNINFVSLDDNGEIELETVRKPVVVKQETSDVNVEVMALCF